MLAEPDRAPEYIALAAAERFGPQAEEWVRIAGAGPHARAARAGRLQQARAAGPARGRRAGHRRSFTAAPDMVALLWIQSRMVFYIAAAYGYDPRHPMRPAELLALQGLYDTPAEAREALDGMGKRMAQAMVEKALARAPPMRSTCACSKYLAQALGAALRGQADPAHRRADRRDAERAASRSSSAQRALRTTRARRRGSRRRSISAESSETRKRTTFAISAGWTHFE